MTLFQFPIVRLTLALIIGICLGYHELLSSSDILFVLLGSFGLFTFFFQRSHQHFRQGVGFGLVLYLLFSCIGYYQYLSQQEKNKTLHYSHQITNESAIITFTLDTYLKPTTYHHKYRIKIHQTNQSTTSGKVLLNIRKDALNSFLKPEQYYVAKAYFMPLPKPLNPHQYDYGKLLRNRNINHQITLNRQDIIESTHTFSSLNHRLIKERLRLQKVFQNHLKDETALAIIFSLLLGDRNAVDSTTYGNYVDAGAIHILAVSGLHIGIIVWLLGALLKPLRYLKNGHIITGVLLLVFLWMYAFFTGGSPSVLRAVTMFSFFIFAKYYRGQSNPYNTLFVSAFFLLLFKPNFLFEIGFQLSYLAVLGILWLQPKFTLLWTPKYWIFKKLWTITTVSFAAQIAVLPLSLFYFHQFPGLFFLTNLVVLPFLGLILGYGFLMVLCHYLHVSVPVLFDCYATLIGLLNQFIRWVASFKGFVLSDIPFSLPLLISSYLLLISIVRITEKWTAKNLQFLLVAVLIFQCGYCYQVRDSQTKTLVVFNHGASHLIGLKNKHELTLYGTAKLNNTMLKAYRIGECISNTHYKKSQRLYRFAEDTILIVDSLGVYENLSFSPQVVVLSYSPKINLNRLIDSLQPRLIIADASNYKSDVRRWELTCKQKKLPFHYTNESGAYIFKE